MNNEESAQVAASIFARAMTDPDFKAQFVADAAAVLRAEGLDVPEGVTYKIVENSATLQYLVLPDPNEISDELLASASGGSTNGTAATAGTIGTVCGTVGSALTAGTAGSWD